MGFVAVLLASAVGQEPPTVPAGVTLPIELSHKLKFSVTGPIEAKLTQDVQFGDTTLKQGTRVYGTISRGERGCATLRFERVGYSPIRAGIRAMASWAEINQTGIPTSGSDRGISQGSYNLVLVGGDMMYGFWGKIYEGKELVGRAEAGNAISQLLANPRAGCTAASEAEHAMGRFSASACGLYWLDAFHLKTKEDDPEAVVCSTKKKPKLPSGTALLLLTTE
jgi:hypothetical protein